MKQACLRSNTKMHGLYYASYIRPLKINFLRIKRLTFFLILFVATRLCFGANHQQLPEEPWKAIVDMNMNDNSCRWGEQVSIKLYGVYSISDSIMVENSIKYLNESLESTKLFITDNDRGRLEIYFLNGENDDDFTHIVSIHKRQPAGWHYISANDTIKIFSLAFHLNLISDTVRQNFITNNLVFAMYPHYWFNNEYLNSIETFRRKSIFQAFFNPGDEDFWYKEPGEFDRQIIKTVYASNFAELIPIASNQFMPIPSWVRDNSYGLMIFPLVLVLFIFMGLIILFFRKYGVRIKNKVLQFNVIAVITLLMIEIVTSVYVFVSSLLTNSNFHYVNLHQFLSRFDFKGFTVAILIIGLPALNIFRLIEMVIHRKARDKYIKTLLLFLSTSLIPIISMFSIALLCFRKDIDDEGIRIMGYISLGFLAIGAIRALISFFILKEKEIKVENEVKLANLRELKTKAELNALHSKINPHFLYNSLNSIAGLAKTDSDKTEQMALSLSKLFRYSINKEQSDMSTMGEEIEMVNIYLKIEKVRFDDRLTYTIDLPEELKSVKIPRFIIQPLVENAIKHGVSKLVAQGEISVSVHQTDMWIEIAVKDNGPDFPDDLNPGFGLQSIYDKLEILYPNRFELHFVNTPVKQVLIKLS